MAPLLLRVRRAADRISLEPSSLVELPKRSWLHPLIALLRGERNGKDSGGDGGREGRTGGEGVGGRESRLANHCEAREGQSLLSGGQVLGC